MRLRCWLAWLAMTTALAWIPARTASARCFDCTEAMPTAIELETPELGTDGVLVLLLYDGRSGGLLEPSAWDIATIDVHHYGGDEVAGTLEVHPGFAHAAWRPNEPWAAGFYEIVIHVDLPSFPGASELGCEPFLWSAMVEVVDEPRHVVGDETLSVDETLDVVPTRALDTMVCCDGALPFTEQVQGHVCATTQVDFDVGNCSELVGTGQLLLDVTLMLDGQPAPADYTMREVSHERTIMWGDPHLLLTVTEPECFEFEVLDLVTGELTVLPSCHGDAVAGQLGPQALDPTEALAIACSGQAYVCATTTSDSSSDARWDPNACTTWPDDAPYVHPATLPPEDDTLASDGGCRLGAAPSLATGWMLAWALLGLRRRRSRAPWRAGTHRRHEGEG